MGTMRVMAGGVVATVATGLVFWASSRDVQGRAALQEVPRLIESLTEPGQGLRVMDVSPGNGFVTFAASRNSGLLLPIDADAAALDRALAFVDTYGGSFGLRERGQVQLLRAPTRDELGVDHVRLQQMHQGLPVRGGELIVHLRGNRVMAANSMVFDRLPADVFPAYSAGAAEVEARAVVERARKDLNLGVRLSAPRLEIFSGSLFGESDALSRTAWFFEAVGPTVREFIWIDANNGRLLQNFSQLAHAKNRSTYNGNSTNALPGTLARTEGQGPTGNAEVDNAHNLAGATYDYFFNTHGRDSYNGLGGTLISTVNHCPNAGNCPYANAFWNGTQMVYGTSYASADDVVAHELTHAVTEYSAGLLYYYQSGALNESFSDIFGETVDLLSAVGGGNDTPGVRWMMGEDLPIGAIRNMMTPTAFGDPGKMTDPQFFCVNNGWTNPGGDSGGVHINSGVPNHAFALMVDGGTYNGQTVTGLGLDKAARIQYRALTTYLTSGARFVDNFNAVNQACLDLVGRHGITAGDCTETNEAMLAVQMNATWNCAGAVAAPALCSSGQPSAIFSDNLEAGPGNWTFNSTSATNWGLTTGVESSGFLSLYGANITTTSIHNAQKTTSVVVPAGAFLFFRHLFEFENYTDGTSYDGGIMEYSTNAGASWNSAQPLFDAGQNYTDTLEAGGPLPGGTLAFARSSFGYTATRLNLATLAGQSVTFRFRVATDFTVGSLGWVVDDVSIYTCVAGVGPAITLNPVNQAIAPGGDANFTVGASGIGAPTFLWQVSANGGATWTGLSNAPPYRGVTTANLRIDNATVALTGRRYRAVATNAIGSATSASALLTVGAAGPNLVQNGDFSAGSANWVAFEAPDIVWSVVSGVMHFFRANPTTTPSGQAVIFQQTGVGVPVGTPLTAAFDVGNSSTARKRISVLIIDSDFSDITVCTFWLAPGAPLRTYTMRTHTTKAWANAAIYFYAATKGSDGGDYLLDNVSLRSDPAAAPLRTDCVDPAAPIPPSGVASSNLLTNGDFTAGLPPWGAFGNLSWQIAGGVFEFYRFAPALPSGGVLQSTGLPMAVNQIMTATFQLGNSSGVRKRVTVLLHDLDFSDLTACTFWLPAGQPLQSYTMQAWATEAWTNATVSVYAATIGTEQWMRLDDVTLARTPGAPLQGTECIEPTSPEPGGPGLTAQHGAGSGMQLAHPAVMPAVRTPASRFRRRGRRVRAARAPRRTR